MRTLKTLVLGMLVTLCVTAAWAQTGSIQGIVTDKSGAVIQGAEVMVRRLETNATRTVATSGTGVYSVTNLAVGNYEVSSQKEGFKIFKVASLALTVDQALTVDAVLEAGTVTEEVQVNASDVPSINLETS